MIRRRPVQNGCGTHISIEFRDASRVRKVELILVNWELLYEGFELLIV